MPGIDPTCADPVQGAVESSKVMIFIKIKIKIITIIAKVAMPSDDDLNPTPADQIQDAGVVEDGYIMVGEYPAVDVDGTPADKVQGAVEINKVIIFINIKIIIIKIDVQVVMHYDIAVDATFDNQVQEALEINKVIFSSKLKSNQNH